jgi:hypothetical protein
MKNLHLTPKQEPKQKVICTNDVCQGECGSCNFMTLVNVEEHKQERLEEAGLKHCNMIDSFPALQNPLFSFIAGAKSDAAKDYWFKQFKNK